MALLPLQIVPFNGLEVTVTIGGVHAASPIWNELNEVTPVILLLVEVRELNVG